MTKTKQLLLASLLLATTIIFARFLSIKTPILIIGFSFIPIMLCAILLNWKWTILVSGLADLIGALLFPMGAYFFGYTISAILTGLIYGLLINRKDKDWSNKKFIIRLIIACSISLLLVNGCLNTLWIYITTKSAFNVIVPVRIVKQLIMLPIQVAVIYLLYRILPIKKLYTKQLEDNDETDDVEQNQNNTNKKPNQLNMKATTTNPNSSVAETTSSDNSLNKKKKQMSTNEKDIPKENPQLKKGNDD